MSLINEALKKAQKQRTGEAAPMPAIGGESAERIAKRGKSSGAPLLGLGIGGAVVIVAIIGGVLFLQKKPSAPPSPAPIAAAVPAVKSPEPAAPTSPVAPPATASATTPAATVPSATPAVAFVVPATTAPAIVIPAKPEPSAPVLRTEPTTPVVTPPAPVAIAATPAPEAAKAAPQPGKIEARAINYIESLRIAGIRASASDSKVLMNDRVYRIGSVVEAEMGLKLTGITTHSLTFEDDRGASYTRTF